ncbi:MAG: 50S ribosomal protein L20 [Candidatus Moranbacteria bacterium GW2011_GWF1_44_4]|nr:MAG: 50S ribosomal protein L20 [Candidatus Moranbacteria bacterium GW2011_GWF1_44_4]
MARGKRAVGAHKKKRKILKMAKGYKWNRKNRYKMAKDAVRQALKHAYFDRRKKKGNFRRLWNIQINAAVREQGMTYSRFIEALTKKNIALDRKVLADLAQNNPEVFNQILAEAKK